MFTGIIEEIGKIQRITEKSVKIECKTVLENTKLGDSIAVNGVCLTATNLSDSSFTADLSLETLKATSFVELKPGNFVNLERAMKADGRFGGHIVSGHIDGKGRCKCIENFGDFYNLEVELPPELSKYVIKKGSVSINGISLTVAEIAENTIKCAIIPYTFENTNLKYLKPESHVNIEVDMISKYIEKFLSTSDNKSRIDMDFLQENGYL